tara:strand:- start:2594 stop:2818 length:225 start_codon:yes stop_codon:yes gene_type:complete
LADGTAAASEVRQPFPIYLLIDGTNDSLLQHLPRYFAKSGHVDADPKKTKKNGAGKGGWLVTTLRAEPAPSAQG